MFVIRGAIAYTMAISYEGPFRDQFIDTTLVIIFSTVIMNGIAAGPVVRRLGLARTKEVEDQTAATSAAAGCVLCFGETR